MNVSVASKADVPALNRLVNSAYRGESSRAGWTTEADILGGQRIDEARLSEVLSDPKQRLLCLRDDFDEVIGCVCLEQYTDSHGVSCCYLGMLTINPEKQTGGLGKFLIARAEEFARAWGAIRMSLTVIHVRTELMAWYERRGYKRTGETEPFPYGDKRFGLPQRDDLHFVVFEKSLT
jgi:GNAT superfamily N-acetyltransferase